MIDLSFSKNYSEINYYGGDMVFYSDANFRYNLYS